MENNSVFFILYQGMCNMSSAGLKFFQQEEDPYDIRELITLLNYGEERILRWSYVPDNPVIVRKEEGYLLIAHKEDRSVFAAYDLVLGTLYMLKDDGIGLEEVF